MANRVVKVMGNQPKTATVGGKTYHFRSKFEWCWAQYLQLLKKDGHIHDWKYEPTTFYFPNEKTAPVQYTPDFKIYACTDEDYWQECKGHHDGPTNSKLRRMAKHYPEEIFELVLMRIPKKGKGVNRRAVAAKYTRRIIDGGKILRQAGIK